MMDNFLYRNKRGLLAIFIIIILLFFPARRFLRENGFFLFGNKTLKEALLWAHYDSIRVADSLRRIKIDSNIVEDPQKDPLVKSDNKENTVLTRDTGSTYYIIAGSFTDHDNANIAAKKYRGLGYKTSIISMTNRSGIKAELVSVNASNNYNDAVRFLNEFKIKFDPTAWIYYKH